MGHRSQTSRLRQVELAAASRRASDAYLLKAVKAAREVECSLRAIAAAADLSAEGVRKMLERPRRDSA